MPSVIPVELPQNPYEIAIEAGLLDRLGAWMTDEKLKKMGRKALVVSNPTIFKHYGQRVVDSLQSAGFSVGQVILPPGERYKTPSTLQKIYDAALENRLERSSVMVALGGGVIGDMTGFAAATWLRGINVVQVPTSLLAMVDAAIGGKTGVNHPKGKNLIGAFHQPRLVAIDPQVLKTLPVREFRAGMAEVIKYGVIWDAELFQKLEDAKRLDQARYVSDELLQEILARSCGAKAHVVAKDEKESGLREILNYGHTIGHAVESLTGYRLVNHGEAVGIGMVAAGEITVAMGLWTREECDRQNALIAKCALPTQLPTTMDFDAIIASTQNDKKVQAGQVRFVLPDTIGHVNVTDQVTPEVIKQVLQKM
ncbi:3-dehydroquinate synthase [Alkalinema pantanalense]|uniref:3-dehydroquinate synthase n=1 Tax=Alkalinema pantanalense TaxID=1620705 RepID=UPI003D6E9181